MAVQDFQGLAVAFGQAALRAKKAGFDGVQIFAAYGFLLRRIPCGWASCWKKKGLMLSS
jgi:2,4-dienoyl-CoA reductase-like NADH-dependent reductase (Old Yellow Enzyme family)